jgi:uncharacterized protein (DUF736 family)
LLNEIHRQRGLLAFLNLLLAKKSAKFHQCPENGRQIWRSESMGGAGDGEMPVREGKFAGNLPVFGPEGSKSEAQAVPEETEEKVAGPKPDFRIVQPEYVQPLGKTVYKDVGAMWRNVSKSGNEFYTLKIGKLKLLVFPNTR